MGQTQERHWLSYLPLVGHEILVLYKDGSAHVFGWGRLQSDGDVLKIDLLEMGKKEQFPTIVKTRHIHESDIAEISFRSDKDSNEVYLLKRSDNDWLNGLPKSGKCHIFIMCKEWEQSKEIFKGWIGFKGGKIFGADTILEKKSGIEVAPYEMSIEDVLTITVAMDGQKTQIFARTLKQKPLYK